MKRHHITLGAKTSAGGVVVSASCICTIDGIHVALEGDTISCPACKSTGTIRCIGPRIPETWSGKDVALENDLCMCKCKVPPRLVAIQTLKYQEVGKADDEWTAAANR